MLKGCISGNCYLNYPKHRLSVIKHVWVKVHQSVKPHRKEFAAPVTTDQWLFRAVNTRKGCGNTLSIQDDGKIYAIGSSSVVHVRNRRMSL